MKAVLALFALVLISSSSFAYQSANSCYAYTPCQYGPPIFCRVYGYQVVQNYGFAANQSCSWLTIPYQAVQCVGYQQLTDAYGQTVFQFQNLEFHCPGY